MANIALQDGKVVLKDGKASCACCGGSLCPSLPAVCFDGVYSRAWVNYLIAGFCDLQANGPGDVGLWELVTGIDPNYGTPISEFYGYGLDVCCGGSCYGLKDNYDHPIYGTYTLNTLTCGEVQVTIYPPPC